MAGDWIKVETVTPDKPEVIGIAGILGIDQDAVVGKLARLWIWADQQTFDGNANCNGNSVTKAFIDRVTCVTGFADAMEKTGWLRAVEGGVSFPNFDRHNGKTAKKRAETSRRVEKHREKKRAFSGKKSNAKGVTPRVQETSNTNVTPEALQPVIDQRIYDAYPKHVHRADAMKAIAKALTKIDGEALLAIVETYAEARRGEEKQYTPYPASWFNDECWADDPSTWKNGQKKKQPPDLFSGIQKACGIDP